MILNIAICDDDSVHVDLIKSYIQSINMPYKINYILAYDGEELLEKLNGKQMDIVFLDIEMKDLDGIQTGKEIRRKCKDTIIVYLTGYKHFALEAFEIESFNYLIKPIMKDRFIKEMDRILLRIQEKRAFQEKIQLFPIHTKDKLIQLPYEDIYYFEKSFRKIKVYTLDETIEFYGTMKDLIEQIDNSYFIRCHQSYIVSKNKIKEIQEDTIILNGKEEWYIPMSRAYKQYIRQVFYENLFSF